MTSSAATRSYLYGVTSAAHAPDPPPPGVAEGHVRLLRHDGLAAVVSDYRGDDVRELPRETLLRCLLAHQRVLEHVVGADDVLPVEFGSLFADDGEVLEVLAHCRDGMDSQLRSVSGWVEVEVAATWDVERELRDLAAGGLISGAREAIAGAGEPSLDDRVQLGRLVKRELDGLRRRYRDRVLDALRPAVLDVAPNALVTDQMVVNVAALVDRGRRPDLEARVDELDRELGPRLRFRLLGPMPPYTFSTVRVTRLRSEDVEAAHATLRTAPPLDEVAARRAFRLRAAEAQASPEEAAGRLVELRTARDVLLRACSSAPADGGRGDRWVLSVRPLRVEEVEPARFGAGA
jgi:hypothetical protein